MKVVVMLVLIVVGIGAFIRLIADPLPPLRVFWTGAAIAALAMTGVLVCLAIGFTE